jgi:undecaprenyl diphosphate synthase
MNEALREALAAEQSTTAINGTAHPRHVAIVSDGSARWAHAHRLSIPEGHEAAADTVIARVGDALQLGVRQLTLYAFSTENWARPAGEVAALVGMLAKRVAADTPALGARRVRVQFIGRRDRAGQALRRAMSDAESLTEANTGLEVFIAFDYGGRDEILRAAERYHGGGEAEFARLLHAPGMRDPELLIRTSGEQRLSNFLLWQAASSELIFRRELWPDFTRRVFVECLQEYTLRTRRFGARAAISSASVHGLKNSRRRQPLGDW